MLVFHQIRKELKYLNIIIACEKIVSEIIFYDKEKIKSPICALRKNHGLHSQLAFEGKGKVSSHLARGR
jgi:hypothetical protein